MEKVLLGVGRAIANFWVIRRMIHRRGFNVDPISCLIKESVEESEEREKMETPTQGEVRSQK